MDSGDQIVAAHIIKKLLKPGATVSAFSVT